MCKKVELAESGMPSFRGFWDDCPRYGIQEADNEFGYIIVKYKNKAEQDAYEDSLKKSI